MDQPDILERILFIPENPRAFKYATRQISDDGALSLVERMAGVKGGGGTRLTARCTQLVENFRLIQHEHRRFIEHLARQAEGIADDYLLIRRMSMKTSARNQFLGKVQSVKRGPVNAEIILDIGGGNALTAIITADSVDTLGLAEGKEAYALIKAPWVIVTADDSLKTSARNRLCGKVARCVKGAVNSELVIELPGGKMVVAVVTNESIEELGLKEGASACALIKASHVILAVAARTPGTIGTSLACSA